MKKNNKKLFLGILILTISLIFFSLVFFKIEPDYLWHFKAGEYMVKNGTILKKDIFSWFVNSKYWMSHEWLFEVIIYGLSLIFGKYHVLVYSLLSIGLLLFILFLSNKNNYLKNIPFTLIWYLMFILLSFGFIQARPHLLSFSFLALTIYVLYDLYKNENSKKIYILPFLSILWANFHGGSSNLPYILCFIFIIGGLFQFKFDKIFSERLSKKQFIKYEIIMFLCMASVCINVHGLKMFIYPYENMLNTTMIENIGEWRSTSLHDFSHYIYYLFLVIIIFTMLFSKKKIELMDLLLLGFSTYLGLKSIRFWLYLYIIMSFVIFNYVPKKKIDNGTFACILGFSIGIFGLFVISFKNIVDISFKFMLDSDVIELIKEKNPKRLYNMYDYGGELIYNNIDVFIDGRADLYSNYNYKDYLDISSLKGDYVKTIEKYDFDYFLVDDKYPISTYLKYNEKYKLIYHKKNVFLYELEN